MTPKKLADPSKQPHNRGRNSPAVAITLPREMHAWLRAQPEGRSAAVRRALSYLMTADRAAWLAQNEDTAVLRRALMAREALGS
ncbi:MAG: hypothetical protein FJ304_22820 [Planctomycetes bacterium]|nr:hypothetical protein [Planctomycetota bacterium]